MRKWWRRVCATLGVVCFIVAFLLGAVSGCEQLAKPSVVTGVSEDGKKITSTDPVYFFKAYPRGKVTQNVMIIHSWGWLAAGLAGWGLFQLGGVLSETGEQEEEDERSS